MTATIDPATKVALQDSKESLRNRYGAHLKAVVLFGSRARGEFTTDSEADVAVFVDEVRDPLREQLDPIDETFRIVLSRGIHIQPWVFEEGGLKHPNRYRAGHLVKALIREGIPV